MPNLYVHVPLLSCYIIIPPHCSSHSPCSPHLCLISFGRSGNIRRYSLSSWKFSKAILWLANPMFALDQDLLVFQICSWIVIKKEVACKVGSYPLRSTLDGEKVARLFIIKTGTPLIVLGEYLTISRGPHSVMGKLGHMITLEWYKP